MIEVIKEDITKIAVDAIVNVANKSLMGDVVDGEIHRGGGVAILEDCRKIVSEEDQCIIHHSDRVSQLVI